MKYRPLLISLFLLVVMALLIVATWLFPSEGIAVGEYKLRFAQLSTYLGIPDTAQEMTIDTVPQLTEEERQAILQHEQEMAAQEQVFLHHFATAPDRLHYPLKSVLHIDTIWNLDSLIVDTLRFDTLFVDSFFLAFPDSFLLDTTYEYVTDYEYFDELFAAFDGADTLPVNVVHYGDSQIEEDRMTITLREALQRKFGGGGVGSVPLYQSVPTRTAAQVTQPHPTRYIAYLSKYKRENPHYGQMGHVAIVDTSYMVTFTPRKRKEPNAAYYYDHITLFGSAYEGQTLHLSANAQTKTIRSHAPCSTTIRLPDSTRNLVFKVSGHGEVYSIRLHTDTGVTVDNFPMRGSSGTIFSRMSADEFKHYYAQTNTRLIIMQFGGNTVAVLSGPKSMNNYIDNLLHQIDFLQKQAPNAQFLFIGPSDMTSTRYGERRSLHYLETFDKLLAERMNAAGVAYWSMFDTMGGYGSMLRWVEQGWACHDYVHFTRKGSEWMGDKLANMLLYSYDYYRFRKEKE